MLYCLKKSLFVVLNKKTNKNYIYFNRHIEGSEIKFTSVQTARTTLDVAYKYQCVSLVKICIKYLDLNLDVKNVLIVYKNLSNYCNNAHTNAPSAPAFNASTPTETATTIVNMCSALLHNCLLLIDSNANEVLTQDLETLDFRDLSTIIHRETLQIKDELILFDCVMRWLKCECMRISKPVNAITRKEILGDLIYKVRFGLMSRNEFVNGPRKSGVFTTNEINEILVVIDNPTNLGDHDLLRNANVKRVKGNVEPKYLSSRTEPHINNVRNKKKKLKKEKSKALLNCLTVWTVLFD